MKSLSIFSIGLLISFAPLFGAYSGRARVIQKPIKQAAQEVAEEPGLTDVKRPATSVDVPVPLTEEEQLELVKKMGLLDIKDNPDMGSDVSE